MSAERCEWCRRAGVVLKRTVLRGDLVCVDGGSCDATIDLQSDLGEAGERDDSEHDVLLMRGSCRPGWSWA
jgi:hypothetical protein